MSSWPAWSCLFSSLASSVGLSILPWRDFWPRNLLSGLHGCQHRECDGDRCTWCPMRLGYWRRRSEPPGAEPVPAAEESAEDTSRRHSSSVAEQQQEAACTPSPSCLKGWVEERHGVNSVPEHLQQEAPCTPSPSCLQGWG